MYFLCWIFCVRFSINCAEILCAKYFCVLFIINCVELNYILLCQVFMCLVFNKLRRIKLIMLCAEYFCVCFSINCVEINDLLFVLNIFAQNNKEWWVGAGCIVPKGMYLVFSGKRCAHFFASSFYRWCYSISFYSTLFSAQVQKLK